MDDATWDAILGEMFLRMSYYGYKHFVDHGEFDDVVCGSGFCALAYVDAALKRVFFRKVFILERGGKAKVRFSLSYTTPSSDHPNQSS